jgi:hypothetical protein
MKNTLILLLFFATFSLQAQQAARQQRFKLAVVAGVNFCQVDGDDAAGYHKVGLLGGVSTSIVLHKRWQLSVDLLFSQKGSHQGFVPEITNSPFTYTFNYIDVPILINFFDWSALTKKNEEYMKIKAFVGFSYGQLFGGSHNDYGTSTPIYDLYKKYDIEAVGGAGVFITKNFGFDIRYAQSIVPMTLSTYRNQWHRLVSTRVFYQF